MDEPARENESRFEAEAGARRQSFLGEFLEFLRYNKKWWLTPILVVLLLLTVLVVFFGSSLAPFIYTLF